MTFAERYGTKNAAFYSVPKFLERDQKGLFFWGFAKKVQKSDFPRKRSYFLKKVFWFVTIKKTFFF